MTNMTYCSASNHVHDGDPVMFIMALVLRFTSLHARSAKFWFLLCGSLVQSSIANMRSTSLAFSPISALAPSLCNISIAPFFLISSCRCFTNSPSVLHPYADLYMDSLPTKNCAALDPSSTAGTFEYIVSVDTGSCLRRTFNAGFGAFKLCWRLMPETPFLAYWVVAANVLRMAVNEAPTKNFASVDHDGFVGRIFLIPFVTSSPSLFSSTSSCRLPMRSLKSIGSFVIGSLTSSGSCPLSLSCVPCC